MAYPLSTHPLHQAVLAALTTHTGKPRCLQPDRLFVRGRPSDFLTAPRHHPTAQSPRCFVAPIQSVSDSVTLTMSNRRHVEARVELILWYGGANPLAPLEWSHVVARAEEDIRLVCGALCEPGALLFAPNGEETGADGGSLLEGGSSHSISGPIPLTGEVGVVTVVHSFRAGVELTAP